MVCSNRQQYFNNTVIQQSKITYRKLNFNLHLQLKLLCVFLAFAFFCVCIFYLMSYFNIANVLFFKNMRKIKLILHKRFLASGSWGQLCPQTQNSPPLQISCIVLRQTNCQYTKNYFGITHDDWLHLKLLNRNGNLCKNVCKSMCGADPSPAKTSGSALNCIFLQCQVSV